MKTIYFILIAMLFSSIGLAQKFSYNNYVVKTIVPRNASWGKDLVKQLQVGDTIPSFILKGIKNWKADELGLRELKAKLTIIDFWGINCIGCIEHIPLMNDLQKEFGEKLQIVMVSRDTKEAVQWCASGNRRIFMDNKLPMYDDDAVLYKYFYYNGLPLHVWIDSNRVVKSIGEGSNTTAANIKNYFNGIKEIKNEEKRETHYIEYDHSKPIFLQDNGRYLHLIKYYSVITEGTGGDDHLRFPMQKKEIDNINHIDSIFIDNEKPWFTFQVLLDLENKRNPRLNFDSPIGLYNRRIIPAKDSLFFSYSNPETPIFSYEIKVPTRINSRTLEFMRADLERYFGMTMVIEDRPVSCFVIYNNPTKQNPIEIPDTIIVGDKTSGFKTIKVKTHGTEWDPNKNLIYHYNNTVKEIITSLPRSPSDPIFFDATNDNAKRYNVIFHNKKEKYTHPIDRDLIITDLEKAGFMVKKEVRTIPMVVAKDVK